MGSSGLIRMATRSQTWPLNKVVGGALTCVSWGGAKRGANLGMSELNIASTRK